MTRTKHAAEALKAAMPKDTMENIGMQESYRQALEDMVNWIDFDDEAPLTGTRIN